MNVEKLYRYWRKRIFFIVWITYSSFYLCRVNMSIAVPGIMADFGYSKTALGGVMTAFFATYAIGQFVNGQLGDKLEARKFVALGILISGFLNVIFGFSTSLTTMMVIWGLNGYFQSMGWAPSVKTIANWFPPDMRGKMGGLLSSSYQIGNAYSWALAGSVAGILGWRWAFWIPAIIFVASGIHWYVRFRDTPKEAGLPVMEAEANKVEPKVKNNPHLGFNHTLKLVMTNRYIWIVALSLLCLNIVRYGFISWIPAYMFEFQKVGISTSAYKAVALPLAGSLGAFCAGWLTDKYFKLRRAPVSALMLFLLGVAVLMYSWIPVKNWVLSLLFLVFIGFLTYGPHALLVGVIPMDFEIRNASSSVTGFIDAFGYIGAALAGVGSGWLIDNKGWNAAFYLWIGGSIVAGTFMSLLWNYKPQRE